MSPSCRWTLARAAGTGPARGSCGHDRLLAGARTIEGMTASKVYAERLIEAPLTRVWDMIADPSQHRLFDGTGMVGELAGGTPHEVGDIFRMNMAYDNGHTLEHYQSDNLVVAYEPGRVLGWATALPDGAPLGWTWTYELTDESPRTHVRLTYDWTDTSEESIRRFGVPLTDESGLARSLELLDVACRGMQQDSAATTA